MTRALVVSPEAVGDHVAGMGLRALRVAETLKAHGLEVTLATPGDLTREAARADLAVASGHTGRALLAAGFSGALVADLYDPFLVENLSYRDTLGPRVFENDRVALVTLLRRADLVLAATEEQRLFYLGLLLGLGLFSPADVDGDPEARRLVAVAPFGVDAEDPGAPAPPEPLAAAPHDVFFGGVYDWYDPDLVLDAWPEVLASVPDARLLFSRSPNPDTTPQARLARVIDRVRAAGQLDRSVHVVPWVAHARRGGLYRSCRVAVLTHRSSLETQLSFRTRVLDFLWAGLPVVTTPGGAASELVARTGSGLVVPPSTLAGALVSLLLDDRRHAAMSLSARLAAAELRWERVLAPLLDFVSAGAPRRRREGGRVRRTLSRLVSR